MGLAHGLGHGQATSLLYEVQCPGAEEKWEKKGFGGDLWDLCEHLHAVPLGEAAAKPRTWLLCPSSSSCLVQGQLQEPTADLTLRGKHVPTGQRAFKGFLWWPHKSSMDSRLQGLNLSLMMTSGRTGEVQPTCGCSGAPDLDGCEGFQVRGQLGVPLETPTEPGEQSLG